MPFVMSYTDVNGVVYSESYWQVGTIAYDCYNRSGGFTFFGYSSKSYFINTTNPTAIAAHTYTLTNETSFRQSLAYLSAMSEQRFTVVSKLEDYALTVNEPTGSFFASGVKVSAISPSLSNFEVTEYTSSGSTNIALFLDDYPSNGTSVGFSLTINGSTITGFDSDIVIDTIFSPVGIAIARLSLGINTAILPTATILLNYNQGVGNVVDRIGLPLCKITSLSGVNLIGGGFYFDGKYSSGHLITIF